MINFVEGGAAQTLTTVTWSEFVCGFKNLLGLVKGCLNACAYGDAGSVVADQF